MKPNPWFRLAPLLLTLLSASGQAASYPIEGNFQIPPPPRPGSSEDVRDYAELHRLQDTRTVEQCKFADSQSVMNALDLVGLPNRILSKDEFALLQPFLDDVIDTVSNETRILKRQFSRPRPYAQDKTLRPCVRKPGYSNSYPSAHATSGAVLGHLLKKLFPSRSEIIREETYLIGENRIIGGVHHPSDVDAGRYLGDQIWEALEENDAFQKDFLKAQSQLKR